MAPFQNEPVGITLTGKGPYRDKKPYAAVTCKFYTLFKNFILIGATKYALFIFVRKYEDFSIKCTI